MDNNKSQCVKTAVIITSDDNDSFTIGDEYDIFYAGGTGEITKKLGDILKSEKYGCIAVCGGGYGAEDIYAVTDTAKTFGGLVAGSREKSGLPALLRIHSVISSLLMKFGLGVSVRDICSGLLAVDAGSAEILTHIKGGDEFLAEAAVFAAKSGVKVTEVSLESGYTGTEKLSLHPLRSALRTYLTLFLASQSLKYLFSSCAAFAVDYVLLLLLDGIFGNFTPASMETAAPLAWIVSSLTNFFLNRNFVFGSRESFVKSMAGYYGLAVGVFVVKTYVLLEALTRLIHLPLSLAKIIAEVIFFVTNYFVQKKFIFRKNK